MKRLLILAAVAATTGLVSLGVQAQPDDRRGYHRPPPHRFYRRPVFHRPPHFVRRDDRR